MAFLARVTLGSSTKVSKDFQSEEVTVIVSWEMERGDEDLLRFVRVKAVELEEARSLLAQTLQEARAYKQQIAAARAAPTAPSEPEEAVSVALPARAKRQKAGRKKATPLPEDESDDAEKLAAEMAKGEAQEATSPAIPTEPRHLARPSAPDPNQSLTDAQKRAVLVLAQRLMDLQDFPTFLQQHLGKSSVDELTWKEAAGLIGEFQRLLKAQREKEAAQEKAPS